MAERKTTDNIAERDGRTPPAPPHPPRIGHYRILELLGAGLLTHVYRAESDGLGRIVALKVLRSTAGRSSAFHRRFEREARLLASLSHPSLVALYDFDDGVAGEQAPYMVLEHVEGATLAEVLRRLRRLEPEEAATIALEVARALAYAHGREVVHRDVKPGNILIGRSSARDVADAPAQAPAPTVVKLLDFGIALDTPRRNEAATVGLASNDDDDVVRRSLGTAGAPIGDPGRDDDAASAIGTPAYMAPEQLLGERVDARADQFALGIVLYQMLAGARPFDDDDGRPAIQRVRRDPPRPLRSHGVALPRSLERIVLRCLAKRPADRYASTHDLVTDLEGVVAERVEGPSELSGMLRRVLARAGFADERTTPRNDGPRSDAAGGVPSSLSPVSSRASAAAKATAERRRAPVRARAVPLRPTLVGLAIPFAAMVLGGTAIQLRAGGFHRAPTETQSLASRIASATETGYLRIRVRPWAEITIDGEHVGVTPMGRAIALAAGKHVVELVHPSNTLRRVVDIRALETTTLDVTLMVPTPAHDDEFSPNDAITAASASVSAGAASASAATSAPSSSGAPR